MSRSGYTEDCDDQWALIRYRGAVKSSLRGARGQAFLQEMLSTMDAMPVKELVANELQKGGAVCAIGSVGVARGVDMTAIDPEDAEAVSKAFGIAKAMAREIVWENDEVMWSRETPEDRWKRMREWVASNIKRDKAAKQ